MLGAIIGDYVGSPYEFDEFNLKSADFPFFSKRCSFTDDSYMTAAIAEAVMEAARAGESLEHCCIKSMRTWGRRHNDVAYGARFLAWLDSDDPMPYGSYGNGSAMRVSPVAWVATTLEQAEGMAAATARVTHNHPEAIKGAMAIAGCIFLARKGTDKNEIRNAVRERYGYPMVRTLDDIRPGYHHDVSCQGSVPVAIEAFLESEGFEGAVRLAVSVGGDSDTIACMAGAITEAAYGIPESLKRGILDRMPDDLASACRAWRDNVRELRRKEILYGLPEGEWLRMV